MVSKISKKKYKQRFYWNKNKKISIRFLYNFLIFIIIWLSLFLVISIYFSAVNYIDKVQIQTQDQELKFVFIDYWWIEHNVSEETNEHWAPNKWDYLFKDYTTWSIFWTWKINTWVINTWIANTWIVNTWIVNTWVVNTWVVNTWVVIIIQAKKFTGNNCIAPRWKIIEHWDSVLAYEQRKDVPDVCNIQRRVCDDWFLWWNFVQKSCKTDIAYIYNKQEVITYNEKKIDPLIQPDENSAINKWADFDNQWKINWVDMAYTVRDNYVDTSLENNTNTVDQTEIIRPNCVSPRWAIVLNWQFVKAYRYKNWFINYPCEVELRPCMQWQLEWSYTNSSCQHRDISYEDFMDWYFNKEQPSMLRIIETLNTEIPQEDIVINKPSIRDMISNLWK